MHMHDLRVQSTVRAYYSDDEICVTRTVRCPSRKRTNGSILWPLQSCTTAPHWSNRIIAGCYIRSYEIKRLLDNRNIYQLFFLSSTLSIMSTRAATNDYFDNL